MFKLAKEIFEEEEYKIQEIKNWLNYIRIYSCFCECFGVLQSLMQQAYKLDNDVVHVW